MSQQPQDGKPIQQDRRFLQMAGEAIKTFLENKDLKPQTRKHYQRALEMFSSFLQSKRISNPIPADLIRFRDEYLALQGLAPRTRSFYLWAVKSFFSFLAKYNLYPNIGQEVKGVRQSDVHARRWLTARELRRILDNIQLKTIIDYRDYALINLMARCGLTPSEAATARVGDIEDHDQGKQLFVRGTSERKQGYVKLTEKAWKPLKDYLSLRGALKFDDPLFAAHSTNRQGQPITVETIGDVFRRRLAQAGIDSRRVSALSLRYSAAALALLAGSKLKDVQAMLRQRDPITMQKYLRDIRTYKQRTPEDIIDF